ncbi:MAG: 50S ribosomal protein L6 [Acidobacteriota bacterium]
MSRLASKPIKFESSITTEIKGDEIILKNSKGELSVRIIEGIKLKVESGEISVERESDIYKANQGLVWSLLNNAVIGLTKGYSRKLEIVGKGWRSEVKGDSINLQVGYSHPVVFKLPKGVTAKQDNPGQFVLSSIDKQLLGQVCANIQKIRPVEPYKLKGIRLEGQYLRKKVRKTAGV